MEKRFEQGIVYITLGEKLDYDLSIAAEEEIIPFLEEAESSGAIAGIVLDADALSYISSAGIRLLLKLKKRIPDMRVLHVADNIYDTISITGMEEIFGLELKSAGAVAVGAGTMGAGNQNAADAGSANTGVNGAANAGAAGAGSNGSADTAKRTPYDRKSWQKEDTGIRHTGINATVSAADFYAVTEMFEDQVKKHAKETAVVSSKGSYTYEELNKAANRIANTLLYMGAQPEDIVCIMLERGIEIYAATLGVLKSGAAYTIVNPKYPDERIEYIYRDAGCKFIISSQQMVYDRLELFVDQLQKRPLFYEHILSWPDTKNPDVPIYPEDLCYVIYTSGSTGKPKGVMIEHGNLANFLLKSPENHEFMGYSENGNSCLAMAQMSFDFSIMEEYIPLVSGKKVALALYEEIGNPDRMIDFMNKHEVDAACFTPSYLSALMRLPKSEEAVKRLKVIDFGAESFPGTLYSRIRAWNPDVLIMNGYGPTEATISCTMKVIDSADNITIGRPNANVSVFAIDEQNNEVPNGETGELLIRGQGVGRGYINLPEKTSEVFIDYRGMRAYKSGDLVRINQNNEIEYLGRKDNQVKIRGLRIELGEVENVIANTPGINLCVAASIDDQYLCLYYTSSTSIPEETVREYAKEHLAHYMVPDIYMLLDRMPMTINQKIDRKALPRPVIQAKNVTPAENEEQQKLLDLLQTVMTEGQYGIDTNLLEIGMSSLDVMLLISLIGEQYEIGIRIGDLNAHPTIRELEQFIKNAPKLKKHVKRDRYPATMLQMTDYFATIGGEGSMNIPTIYELDPSIDNNRLIEAIYATMEAHPGLTMRFETDAQGALYMVPQDDFRDYEVKITRVGEEIKDLYQISRRIASDAKWLFRFEIIETPTKKYLFTDYSHLNSDGVSVEIVIEDILSAYEGNKLEPEYYTMFELGEFLSDFWETKAGKRCTELYLSLLEKSNGPVTIPPDKNEEGWIPKRITMPVSVNANTLNEFCDKNHLTESTVLSGALGIVLSKYTKHANVSYAYGFSGRTDSRLSNTVGYVANILGAFCFTQGHSTFFDYLQNYQKNMINLMMYPMMPLMPVMEKYPNALDVLYVFQPKDQLDYETDGKKVHATFLQEEMPNESVKAIFQPMVEQDDSISWVVDYHGNLYSENYMRKIIEEINKVIEAILKNEDMEKYLH